MRRARSRRPRAGIPSLAEARRRRRLLARAEREERKLEALRAGHLSVEEMHAVLRELERRFAALWDTWGASVARACAAELGLPYRRTRAVVLLDLRARASGVIRDLRIAAFGGSATPDTVSPVWPLRPHMVAATIESFWQTILRGLAPAR